MQNLIQVETQMLIRKPVEVVFNAFIDASITTKFWFSRSSGNLETGKKITWYWDTYAVSDEIEVLKIQPNVLISIQWDNLSTTVDFHFRAISSDSTYVVINNYGFKEEGDALIEAIKNNTGGFTTVLDGLKAYLEFGIELNLVRDKFLRKSSI
jgi:uncharacterized protein YndB with AHSA1/START domain